MLVRVLPAALFSLITGRRWRPRHGPARALADAQVVADVSGIAFMDGRGIPTLIYNVLLVFLPWAFGVPVVKIAQALGPFRNPLNRLAAKATLRLVSWIGLRGAETAQNFEILGVGNAEPAADIAFLLEVGPKDEARAASQLPKDGHVTLIVPSAVVEQSCRAHGIDYVARMAQLVDGLTAAGHVAVLIAHSAREDEGGGHTNDLPTCRRIAETSQATLIDREIDARQLRALIGRSRMLITSRFHALISGLATTTPTFVVGWSHKYREVLFEFGLEEWVVDFRDLTDEALLGAILRLDGESESIRAQIEARLPSVRLKADRNIDRLVEVLKSNA
jgi:polysaccharide pyruvyl transferase WcaK-like protein